MYNAFEHCIRWLTFTFTFSVRNCDLVVLLCKTVIIIVIADLNKADVSPSAKIAMTRRRVLCVGQSHLILGSPGGVVTRATDMVSIVNSFYDDVLVCTCCCLDYVTTLK